MLPGPTYDVSDVLIVDGVREGSVDFVVAEGRVGVDLLGTVFLLQKGCIVARNQKRCTTWYVEPIGENYHVTNRVISGMLQDENAALEEVPCADGARHNLWRMPDHSHVSRLKGMRANGIAFRVWVQQGGGAIKVFAPDNRYQRTAAKQCRSSGNRTLF